MVEAARNGTTINYRPVVTDILGLEGSGDRIPPELGQLCGAISDDEHDTGRPLLSAIVINQEMPFSSEPVDVAILNGLQSYAQGIQVPKVDGGCRRTP